MSWNPSDQPGWPDKDVDIKDCATKYDRRQEVEVADDESQRFMKGALKGIGLLQYTLGDRVPVAVLDIGKANGLQRTAGAFLMAKYAPLSCLRGVLVSRVHRGDYGDEED